MATDHEKAERDAIQEELHIEVLPGTEIMTDIGKHHFIKSSHSSVVLVPQPSQDPNDPLNWSRFWKLSTITMVSCMTFTQGFAPLSLAPMFPYFIKDFNSDLEGVIQFTGVSILILGFSNFIWAPISSSFGRRPTFLASQLICLASYILRARSRDYATFMGACVLNGIGAGPCETLQPTVTADIFFLHDRGTWNTLYWVTYMGSLMVGPIVSGAMADHVGWESFWWLNVAMTGATIVLGVVGFPETRWHRAEHHPDSVVVGENIPGTEQKGVNTPESAAVQTENAPTPEQEQHDMDPYLGKGKPSKQQWQLFQVNSSPLRGMLFDLWTPWRLFAYPIVVFASFVASWSCSNFLILNLTQSQVFAAPPYNMSSQSIGFTNFAVLVGALFGLATAGPFSDWVSARATKANGGVREPEMRLPAMIPYMLIMIVGNFINAFGYQHQWHWAIIVVIGYTCAGIQVAALPSIASTYAIDSYKPVAGPLMVALTVNKNVWGYGMGKFITPWSIKSGFIPVFMTNMSLTVLWCAFGVVFFYYGKTFRRWTRNSSVHRA